MASEPVEPGKVMPTYSGFCPSCKRVDSPFQKHIARKGEATYI